MRTAAFLLIAFLTAQEHAFRADYPQDGVFWEWSWKSALAESHARQTPMMWVFQKEGGEACRKFAAIFQDKKYIEFSRQWVNLVAHPVSDHEVAADLDRKRTLVCDLYWNIPCSAHGQCEQEMRNMYKDLRGVVLPTEFPSILFLDWSDKELGRITGPCSVDELMKKQAEILAAFPGDKIPAGPWREAKAALKEGETLLKKKEWQMAIHAYTGLKGSKWKLVQAMGNTGLMKVSHQGNLKLADARKLLDASDKKKLEEAKKKLEEIVRDFHPLEPARSAEEILTRLKAYGK